MKAIIVTGGKQYLVTEGDTLYVEKLDNEVNSDVKFNEVLYVDGKVGTPTVKYKNKTKSSRVTKGHRQPYTKIEIKKIVG